MPHSWSTLCIILAQYRSLKVNYLVFLCFGFVFQLRFLLLTLMCLLILISVLLVMVIHQHIKIILCVNALLRRLLLVSVARPNPRVRKHKTFLILPITLLNQFFHLIQRGLYNKMVEIGRAHV